MRQEDGSHTTDDGVVSMNANNVITPTDHHPPTLVAVENEIDCC
jgi:hypothetical protein